MCVDFYYKLVLINKFIKYNQVNDLCCDFKYLDLHLSLNFLNMFLFIIDELFIYLFIYTMVHGLFNSIRA